MPSYEPDLSCSGAGCLLAMILVGFTWGLVAIVWLALWSLFRAIA